MVHKTHWQHDYICKHQAECQLYPAGIFTAVTVLLEFYQGDSIDINILVLVA